MNYASLLYLVPEHIETGIFKTNKQHTLQTWLINIDPTIFLVYKIQILLFSTNFTISQYRLICIAKQIEYSVLNPNKTKKFQYADSEQKSPSSLKFLRHFSIIFIFSFTVPPLLL